MTLLADLEQLLERIFERTSARVFKPGLRPIQLQRRIERTMELGRRFGDRTEVPDRFRLRLHPTDLEALADVGGFDALAASLADAALSFARAHSYHLRARPSVALIADASVEAGAIAVDPSFTDEAARHQAPAPPQPEPPAGTEAGSAVALADEPVDPSATRVFRRPIAEGPKAILREVLPDGSDRTLEVNGAAITIGRSRDNALVIDDVRVSRHHGRLQPRRGALVYTDLGSTNGTRVNGLGVDEIALGPGDRIEIGDTVLIVESLPG